MATSAPSQNWNRVVGVDGAHVIRERTITHADLPPSLLALLSPRDAPASLETIVIGGEVCPPAAVRAWASRVRLVSVYGPTEATVCTSLCICDPAWQRPLIGQPIPGVELAILDEAGNPVEPATPGELYIGGAGVALGYVDRPALEVP